MAQTASSLMPLGTVAPDFSLPDTVTGKTVSAQSLQSPNGTVVMFICNHCPYVLHIIEELVAVSMEYTKLGMKFVAISSNDVATYPQDGPEKMREFATLHGFPFPYLYDETQDVARAYGAECTPDIYVFDAQMKCVYRGQFDDSRPRSDTPVTGKDLRNALSAVISHKPVDTEQVQGVGCNIKWKAK